jgi:hypothetical protein
MRRKYVQSPQVAEAIARLKLLMAEYASREAEMEVYDRLEAIKRIDAVRKTMSCPDWELVEIGGPIDRAFWKAIEQRNAADESGPYIPSHGDGSAFGDSRNLGPD